MPRNILVLSSRGSCLNLVVEGSVLASELKQRISSEDALPPSSFFLACGGVPLEATDLLVGEDFSTAVITAHPRTLGGKGGFGSLIRAMGTHMNKSSARLKHSCRDLSGRRVRDVKAEEKLAEWIKAEPERQRKLTEEKRKRLAKRRAEPKHYFNDPTYMQQIKATEEGMDGALKQGLQVSSSKAMKRKHPVADQGEGSSGKKPKLWLRGDEPESDSDAEEDIEEEEEVEGDSDSDSGEVVGEARHNSSESDGSSSAAEEPGSEPGPSGLGGSESGESKPSTVETVAEPDCTEPSQAVSCQPESNKLGRSPPPSPSNGSSGAPELDTEATSSRDQLQKPDLAPTGEHEVAHTGSHGGGEAGGSGDTLGEVDSSIQADEPVCLEDYSSPLELSSAGPERLKAALQALGLKCGGMLQERAQRLFATKGKTLEELDPSFFAKSGKQRRRRNK